MHFEPFEEGLGTGESKPHGTVFRAESEIETFEKLEERCAGFFKSRPNARNGIIVNSHTSS
jgi:hypothetical protein